eukprot:scaffold33510_cov140-Skeletonema_dohrnii-CCMP3373.AAC.6
MQSISAELMPRQSQLNPSMMLGNVVQVAERVQFASINADVHCYGVVSWLYAIKNEYRFK